MHFDDAVLQAAADDFGRVVHKKPAAVLLPGNAQDIAKLVQLANHQELKVAMRGQGHSFFGQTQVADGVVVNSSGLNSVRIVKSGAGGTAEIGPSTKHPVLMAANTQKLTVPVIADTFLSVGGTISTGGFGVTTYNLGLQVNHVQELEVVAPGPPVGQIALATAAWKRGTVLGDRAAILPSSRAVGREPWSGGKARGSGLFIVAGAGRVSASPPRWKQKAPQ